MLGENQWTLKIDTWWTWAAFPEYRVLRDSDKNGCKHEAKKTKIHPRPRISRNGSSVLGFEKPAGRWHPRIGTRSMKWHGTGCGRTWSAFWRTVGPQHPPTMTPVLTVLTLREGVSQRFEALQVRDLTSQQLPCARASWESPRHWNVRWPTS